MNQVFFIVLVQYYESNGMPKNHVQNVFTSWEKMVAYFEAEDASGKMFKVDISAYILDNNCPILVAEFGMNEVYIIRNFIDAGLFTVNKEENEDV